MPASGWGDKGTPLAGRSCSVGCRAVLADLWRPRRNAERLPRERSTKQLSGQAHGCDAEKPQSAAFRVIWTRPGGALVQGHAPMLVCRPRRPSDSSTLAGTCEGSIAQSKRAADPANAAGRRTCPTAADRRAQSGSRPFGSTRVRARSIRSSEM